MTESPLRVRVEVEVARDKHRAAGSEAGTAYVTGASVNIRMRPQASQVLI